MLGKLSIATVSLTFACPAAYAQEATPLTAYADAKGYLDVQTLTCGQLAGTYQQDADALTSWYSGWYNGLARKHLYNVTRAKELKHEVIVYCKANQEKKIIEAIAVVFDDERAKLGIKMK